MTVNVYVTLTAKQPDILISKYLLLNIVVDKYIEHALEMGFSFPLLCLGHKGHQDTVYDKCISFIHLTDREGPLNNLIRLARRVFWIANTLKKIQSIPLANT